MWKLKEYERAMYKIIDIIDENGKVIKTFVADDLDYSRKKKQAKLMAAAPELLEELEKANNILDDFLMENKNAINDYWYNNLGKALSSIFNTINKVKGVGE